MDSSTEETTPVARLKRFVGWVDDRWNPVLVKEVRQALRGRAFRFGFQAALTIAVIAATTWIARAGQEGGPGLLGLLLMCLSIAILVQVPFSAFTSMTAEWDDDSIDMLLVSPLRPVRIVMGKLLAAQVQTLLYIAAFAPFMQLATLMKGVDVPLVAQLLTTFVGLSFVLTSFALLLSVFAYNRQARVLLLAVLAGVCLFVLAVPARTMMVVHGLGASSWNLMRVHELADVVIWTSMFTSLALGAACARITPPSENRTTAMRVLVSIVTLLGIASMAIGAFSVGGSRHQVSSKGIMVMVLVAIAGLFFATEPVDAGRIGRRWAKARRRRWFLGHMYAPGGGFGGLYLLVHLGLVVSAGLALHIVHGLSGWSGSRPLDDGAFAMIIAAIFVSGYILIPAGSAKGWSEDPRRRVMLRAGIPALVLLGIVGFPFLGFLMGLDSDESILHFANPVHLIDELWSGRQNQYAALLLLTVMPFSILMGMARLTANWTALKSATLEPYLGRRESVGSASEHDELDSTTGGAQ